LDVQTSEADTKLGRSKLLRQIQNLDVQTSEADTFKLLRQIQNLDVQTSEVDTKLGRSNF
jgi:hypothetical protein